jgi:hypothetical protein
MLRRFTGLLLTASLTLLSLSQGVGCSSHKAPATASHHSMSMVMDTPAQHDCGDAPPAQPCGHMVFGDCAGMSSCSAPSADVQSAVGACAPAHVAVIARLASVPASQVTAPGTPPPRA